MVEVRNGNGSSRPWEWGLPPGQVGLDVGQEVHVQKINETAYPTI